VKRDAPPHPSRLAAAAKNCKEGEGSGKDPASPRGEERSAESGNFKKKRVW